ncbi:MAG: ethylbenzene dehydrogenase-related protein [Gammaproteobacteria bacterium]
MNAKWIALVAGLAFPLASPAVDWAKVLEKELVLFQPGQASWEWALTERDHSGAPKFREGKNCKGCHEGEQSDIGAKIAKGGKLEPAPIAGPPGGLGLRVQAAHDADRLYFRLRWKAGPANGKKMDPQVAARATVMWGDGAVKEAARAGCWGSCHDDGIGMASAAPDGKITKYLGASRVRLSRQGGGENYKSPAELQALIQQGTFLEYWQARLNPGRPAEAASGYVLDKRHADAQAFTRAEASFANGEWTVVLSRPLRSAAPTQKTLAAGKPYAIGFAIHDDYTDHRFHYVSLEQSLVLDGGAADFVVKAQ